MNEVTTKRVAAYRPPAMQQSQLIARASLLLLFAAMLMVLHAVMKPPAPTLPATPLRSAPAPQPGNVKVYARRLSSRMERRGLNAKS